MASYATTRDPNLRFGTVVALTSAHIFLWAVQGALPALFPPLARHKGLNAPLFASPFAFFGLTRLVFGRLDQELLSVARPKFYLVSGIFLSGGATLLTGILQWCPGGGDFFILSFLLQALSGVGVAFLHNNSLLILDLAFPTDALYYVALLESFSLAGLLAGAPFAAFLATLFNYSVPFILLGCFLLASAFVAYLACVDERPAFQWCSSEDSSDLCRFPLVRSAQALTFFNSSADVFLLVSLTGHIGKLHPSDGIGVASSYLLMYLCYCASYLLVKILASHTGRRSPCRQSEFLWSMFGCLSSAAGFLLLGPINFRFTQPTAVVLGSSLVLRSLGCGCVASGAFAAVLRTARKRMRLPYDTQTHALVSRTTSLPASAGYFCGSLALCTISTEFSSMEIVCSILAVVFIIMAVCSAACHVTLRRQTTLSSEDTPLCDCSLQLDARSPFPSSPTILTEDDWQWLIQRRDDELQPSL